MAQTVNVTVDDSAETVNVTVSDGLLTASGGGTFINGFLVTKGAGNVLATIEVGDKVIGWISQVFVAGEVLTIPVNDVSDVDPAVQGEFF